MNDLFTIVCECGKKHRPSLDMVGKTATCRDCGDKLDILNPGSIKYFGYFPASVNDCIMSASEALDAYDFPIAVATLRHALNKPECGDLERQTILTNLATGLHGLALQEKTLGLNALASHLENRKHKAEKLVAKLTTNLANPKSGSFNCGYCFQNVLDDIYYDVTVGYLMVRLCPRLPLVGQCSFP